MLRLFFYPVLFVQVCYAYQDFNAGLGPSDVPFGVSETSISEWWRASGRPSLARMVFDAAVVLIYISIGRMGR